MDKVTPEALMTFFWVGAALIALTLAVWALVDKIRNARKPTEDLNAWRQAVSARLDSDQKRIDSMEDGQRAICRGILALLSHEINGNSVEKLRDAQSGITDYLIKK